MTKCYVPHIGSTVRLGRIRPKARPMCLKFGAYRVPGSLPPASVDYAKQAKNALAQMYGNDEAGDCVIAGKMHLAGVWTGNDDTAGDQPDLVGTREEALRQYQQICGPGDNGCNISDVLDYMHAHGIVVGGKNVKIDAYVSVDHTNVEEVKVAILLFGGLTIGINLPRAWADNAKPNGIWDVTNSEIVGGHDVCVVGYDDRGVQICTWGMVLTISWMAFQNSRWVEECYAQLSESWYGSDKLSKAGVDAKTLLDDINKLGGGVIPPLPEDPPPIVPPVPPAPTPPGPGLWAQILAFIMWLLTQLQPHARSAEVANAFAQYNAHDEGAITDWIKKIVMALIANAPELIAIVTADLAAGKPWPMILLDILAALHKNPKLAEGV